MAKIANLFEILKLELLQSGVLNKVIDAYIQIQDGIERTKGAIFWANINMIAPRIQNWFSEFFIGMKVGISGVYNAFVRMVEQLAGMLRRILNPFEGAFDGLFGADGKKKAKTEVNAAFSDGSKGLNTELVKPNVTAAGQKDKAAFSPNVTINAGGQTDPNALAAQVMTALDAQYSKYREEKL
jgi:hypothetical protein